MSQDSARAAIDESGALIIRISLYLGLALTIGLSSGEVALTQLTNAIPVNEPFQMVLLVFLIALTVAVIAALQVRTAVPPSAIIEFTVSIARQPGRNKLNVREPAVQILLNLLLIGMLLGAVAAGTTLYEQFTSAGFFETTSWFLGLYIVIVALTRRFTWFLLKHFEFFSLTFYGLMMFLLVEYVSTSVL
ncbi:hypothetical protein BRD01_10200 [Halobacteriales archaeon QS_8_65_32]|nr:MAG: hypothetical protein BRD01_10200 [Halobacteriales archaeon QS_8_65_32]